MKKIAVAIILSLFALPVLAGGGHKPKKAPVPPQPRPVINITNEYITNEYITEETYITNNTECDYCAGFAAAAVAGDNIHFDHDRDLQGGIAAGTSDGQSAMVGMIGGPVGPAIVSGSVFYTSQRKKGFGAGVSFPFQ